MDRFRVVEHYIRPEHPYLGGQVLYKLEDTKRVEFSMGAWTKKEIAEELCKEKNVLAVYENYIWEAKP